MYLSENRKKNPQFLLFFYQIQTSAIIYCFALSWRHRSFLQQLETHSTISDRLKKIKNIRFAWTSSMYQRLK